MRVYEVKGVDETGNVVTIATADTATDALVRIEVSRGAYRRIWVQDETGSDIDILELIARSKREREA